MGMYRESGRQDLCLYKGSPPPRLIKEDDVPVVYELDVTKLNDDELMSAQSHNGKVVS
jgi:hypothetical protein